VDTKIVMTTSATTLGFIGLVLTFIPDEVLRHFNWDGNKIMLFQMQILGALYFAFGMLNWVTRSSLIGGIYNRPVAIANFSHFMIGALALTKGLISDPYLPLSIYFIGIYYAVFAILFGIILIRNPINEPRSN
jgi:hypothetical protein